MYIKINNKKLNIKEYKKIKDRFKSFKFFLYNIDFGIKLPNKKIASTYFFCQRIDICFTDKDDKILYLYNNVKSEKLIIKLKAKNIYYFPKDTNKYLKVGEKLKITKK